MAAPTRVSFGSGPFNSVTTPKTSSVTTQVGDRVAVFAIMENGSSPSATAPSGGGLSFSSATEIGTTNAVGRVVLWTATVGSGQDGTYNISITRGTSSSSIYWGPAVWVYRGSDGFGTITTTGASANTITSTLSGSNSAWLIVTCDWNAADGTSRTPRTVNSLTGAEETYFRDSSRYTVYIQRYDDAGAAGSKTGGYSAPSGQSCAMIALEILGTASTPSVSPGFTGSGDLTASVSPVVPKAVDLTGSGALTAAVTKVGAEAVALTGSGDLTASAAKSQPVAVDLTGSGDLTALLSPVLPAVPGFSGDGVLTVDQTGAVVQATAGFSGSGDLAAAASSVVPKAVDFSGDGELSAQAAAEGSLDVDFTGSGDLSIAQASPVLSASVSLAGDGVLSAAALKAAAVAVELSGSGDLSIAQEPVVPVALGLSGDGVLSADASQDGTTSPVFTGVGMLSASLSPVLSVASGLSGSGDLSVAAVKAALAAVDLSGDGVLSTGTTRVGVAAVALSGVGVLAVQAQAQEGVVAGLSGSGQLSVIYTAIIIPPDIFPGVRPAGTGRWAVAVALAGYPSSEQGPHWQGSLMEAGGPQWQ